MYGKGASKGLLRAPAKRIVMLRSPVRVSAWARVHKDGRISAQNQIARTRRVHAGSKAAPKREAALVDIERAEIEGVDGECHRSSK